MGFQLFGQCMICGLIGGRTLYFREKIYFSYNINNKPKNNSELI